VIPVRVIILQAWEGAPFIALPGAITNISRGGARVQLRWECPQRARLLISVAAAKAGSSLSAEVVYSGPVPGGGCGPPVFGVRWVEKLSSETLRSVLAAQGLTASLGEANAPWA
jgi:hypothetical protein